MHELEFVPRHEQPGVETGYFCTSERPVQSQRWASIRLFTDDGGYRVVSRHSYQLDESNIARRVTTSWTTAFATANFPRRLRGLRRKAMGTTCMHICLGEKNRRRLKFLHSRRSQSLERGKPDSCIRSSPLQLQTTR